MKKSNNPRLYLMALMVAVLAAFTWSCDKDEDPSLTDLREDKLSYLEDSLRISDSLKRINAAGIVNYSITIVNGSTSSFAGEGLDGGRTKQSQNIVDGAIITISQFGKTETDTTDENGIVVFNGFFRSAVNVSVRKEGFTSVNYMAAVSVPDSTTNGSISFVGNLIPIFETEGPNTATIKGRATIQTNLTNRTREIAPDGTTVLASIDATSGDFEDKYLTSNLDVLAFFDDVCECQVLYAGAILQAAYSSGVVGTVTGGEYTITVPAAVDALPIVIEYSEIAADQILYESDAILPGDRQATYRNIFAPGLEASDIPTAESVEVEFAPFTPGDEAQASATISTTSGSLDRITVTGVGSGYTGTPLVQITGGNGTGATATATVVNGTVTGITLTNSGTGYTSAPGVALIAGTGATGSVTTLGQDGTVTSVIISNSGSGYTTAPTVTFTAATGTGLVAPVTATGTAVISNGRVTGITITNAGAGYVAPPTVTFSAAPAGGTTATGTATWSGQSIQDVQVIAGGGNYTYAPLVTFGLPDITTGTRATGTATINPVTRQVTGITIVNPGSGYNAPPTVTLTAVGVAATATSFLSGGSVLSANMTSQGSGYTSAPAVTITGGGGQGATATAQLLNGTIIGLIITNGGTGYTSAPEIEFESGDGAAGFATVTNGAISAITVTDGGRLYTGAPTIILSSDVGGGGTATASFANGAVTGVTVTSGGTGYLEGNTPAAFENFTSTKPTTFNTKPGLTYINDIHYGTGVRQPN